MDLGILFEGQRLQIYQFFGAIFPTFIERSIVLGNIIKTLSVIQGDEGDDSEV